MNKHTHKQRKENYNERAKELVSQVALKLREVPKIKNEPLVKNIEADGKRIRVNGRTVMSTEKNLSTGYGRGKYDGHVNVKIGGFIDCDKQFFERKKSIFDKVDDIVDETADSAIREVRKRERRRQAGNEDERASRIMTEVFGADYDWSWHPNGNRKVTVKKKAYSNGIKFNVEADVTYKKDKASDENDQKVKELMEEIEGKVSELNELLN